MLEAGRYSPYEDLSEYEKEMEDVALVTPPITKKQTTRRQVERLAGRPQPTKYTQRQPTRSVSTQEPLWCTEFPAKDP